MTLLAAAASTGLIVLAAHVAPAGPPHPTQPATGTVTPPTTTAYTRVHVHAMRLQAAAGAFPDTGSGSA
jgi:hypothetical protein